jgi:hypothetical protein
LSPKNAQAGGHAFLADVRGLLLADSHIARIRTILVDLCAQIELERPGMADGFLRLTHAATERINEVAVEVEASEGELETVAREAIAAEFLFIARAYGFAAVDIEDIVAPRDW